MGEFTDGTDICHWQFILFEYTPEPSVIVPLKVVNVVNPEQAAMQISNILMRLETICLLQKDNKCNKNN